MGANQSSSTADRSDNNTVSDDDLLQQQIQQTREQQYQMKQQIQQMTLQMEQEHQQFQQRIQQQRRHRLQTVSVFDYEFNAQAALAELTHTEQPILNAIVETILRNVGDLSRVTQYLTKELLVAETHCVDGTPCQMEAVALADRGHLVTIITLKTLFRVNADLLERVRVAEAAVAAAATAVTSDSQPDEM